MSYAHTRDYVQTMLDRLENDNMTTDEVVSMLTAATILTENPNNDNN